MASSSDTPRAYAYARRSPTPYPLIDSDPHLFRVCRYARPVDYAEGAAAAASMPAVLYAWERFAPSYAGKGAMPPLLRLAGGLGLGAGFLIFYSRSYRRFLGYSENSREVDMDMREMVDKVKKGEPLYGVSTMPEHHQEMAARNSRNSGFFLFMLPWFNIANHNRHGVDTAKYYQQAERELEEEGK